MSTSLTNLLSTITLADGITLKNRVAMAPLTRARAGHERVPTDVMKDYYTQRASAGLIISEAVSISEQANGWAQTPGVYTAEMIAGWKRVTDSVHAAGGVIACQLWHTGRASHSSIQVGNALPVAPSAIAIVGPGTHDINDQIVPHEVPRALNLDELPGIVDQFRQAARNALDAGFDLIEIHGANGYLLDQFLQSTSNQRTDAYGGSVENRFRLVREVVEAVSEVFSPGRVGIRLSPNGIAGGMGSEDNVETFTYAVAELAKLKVGFIHIIDTGAIGHHGKCRLMSMADFRPLYSGILIANGGYTADSAEQAIASGNADIIAFGRPFIANPDFVQRIENGWPLATPDMSKAYTHNTEGYIDYPVYQPATTVEA